MAAKGQASKDWVSQKIIEAFGDAYAGTYDKKIYVWGNEGGEKIQVAISLTCPKSPVEFGEAAPMTDAHGDWDFSGGVKENTTVKNAPVAEITEEEKENLAQLLAKYGL